MSEAPSNVLDFNTALTRAQLEAQARTRAVEHEVRLERLRQALQDSARELVRDIFPRARIHAGEARIGSTAGEAGESLAIQLDGPQAGLWHDHATGEGGDLIALWQATRGLGPADFARAVDDLERWAGLTAAPRTLSPVSAVARARAAAAANDPPQPANSLGPAVKTWHYLSADGAVLGIVRRYDLAGQVDETTGKPKKTFRPTNARGEPKMPDPRPLYRIPHIINASTVVLVEGEKKADALETVGVEATTAMGGAKADPAKTDWSPLAGKTVIVWEDNDEAGSGLAERVRPSLEAIGCTVLRAQIPAGKPRTWDAADAVAEGEDVEAIIASAWPAQGATGRVADRPPRKYQLLSVEDLEQIEPLEWLIDGILPAHGFAGLYGPSGGLKSFVAIDIALHIATGREWQGRAVRAGPVVYVAGEGKRGLGKRVLGWRSAKADACRPDFHLLPSAVQISITDDLAELIATLSDLPVKPALVVLDTLARNFGPGDENSQRDMGAFVRGIDRLIDATGAAVIVVHHTGKDDAKGERGSSALRGALDTSILVRRKPGGRRVELVNRAPFGKQKDADEFDDICLVATPVHFQHRGADEKTLILMPDADPVAHHGADGDDPAEDQDDQPEPAQRLGPIEQKILTALGQAATAGQGLRFMRLSIMCGSPQDSSLNKALRRLVQKRQIRKAGEEYLLP